MLKSKGNFLNLVVCLLFCIIAIVPTTANAITQDDTIAQDNKIDFYIRAILPENQLNEALSYFDLLMEPLQKQTLQVEIFNESSREQTFEIEAISASTNRNGIIDYKTPNIRDESLRYPFSEIASVEKNSLTVPANNSKVASIQVSMPSKEYDGAILGGIVVTKTSQINNTQPLEEAGVHIQNIYSYVLGVILRENDTILEPEFELVNIYPESVSNQPAIIHEIRNVPALIVKGLTLDLGIRESRSGEEIIHIHRSDIDMAPNSLMPLAVSLPQTTLSPGTYTSTIQLSYQGKTWDFEQQFTIENKEADEINQTIITDTDSTLPPWFFAILFITLSLLIAITILLIFLLKKRKRENKEEGKNGQSRK